MKVKLHGTIKADGHIHDVREDASAGETGRRER